MQSPVVSPESVKAALERLLASQTLGGAKRSAALLEFLVRAVLEGRTRELKEYTLGADALGRGKDYDPRTDPIARVEASRLRSRLELYYATEGAADDVVISLPKGGYVPQIERRAIKAAAETAAVSPRPLGWRRVAAFAGLLAGAVVLGVFLSFAAPWRAPAPATAAAPSQSQAIFDTALGAPGAVAMVVGSSVAFTPDGESLVLLVLGASGNTSLFVRRLDELAARQLPGTSGAGGAFFFSPDSRWVAFFSEGKLKKTLLDGAGSPATLAEVGDMLGGAWGDDGTIVAKLGREPILWRLSENGGVPEPLVDRSADSVDPRWPQLLPGGRAVLYSAYIGIGSDARIDVTELASQRTTTLIARGSHARYVSSGHLVYLDRGTLFAVAFDVQALAVRGDAVPIVRDVAMTNEFGFGHYDVSASGTLAYLRQASAARTIEWLDGGDAWRPLLTEPGRYTWPRLSPDGKQLAYSLLDGSDSDIWIYDLATHAKRRLTVGGGDQTMAVWTADGRHLVYQESAGPALHARRSDGTGEAQRLLPGVNVPWSFTPDGRRLAYHGMATATGFDLFTVPLDVGADGELAAGVPEVYRALQTYETYPSFSPDGRFVTHGSNESGAWEVYVRTYPGGDQAWRVSMGGGRIPIWAKNGTLFYETLQQQLMTVRYRIENGEFIAAEPRLWSTKQLADTGVIANYDVAADGSVVAVVDSGEPVPRDRVTIVTGFFDQLRAAAP
jgi:serine/threonine-protein kinase